MSALIIFQKVQMSLFFLTYFVKNEYQRFLQNGKLPIKQKGRGWKSIIRDDAFTYPANKSLLAAALGSGSQLLAL